MADPIRNKHPEIESNIRPDLRAINGGGESTPERGDLHAANPAPDLNAAEKKFGVLQGGGESTPERGDLSLASRESDSPWDDKVTGDNSDQNSGSWFRGLLKGTKKKGPLIGIGGGVGIIGILISLFGPITMFQNLTANFMQRYDYQNTSRSIRTDKILAKRLSADITKGSCGPVTIKCRYSRPSNKLLTSMEKNGIVGVDKEGAVVAKKKLGFPNKTPDHYEFTDKAGVKTQVNPKEMKSLLKNNLEFRGAMARAYRVRAMGLVDKTAYRILSKFGANFANKVSGDTDSKKARDTLNNESKPINVDADSRAFDETVKREVKAEAEKAGAKLKKTDGDVLLLAGAVGCVAADAPGFVSKIIRGYQLRYLIKYSFVFLSAADAMKAGNATPSQVSALGTILTETTKSKNSALSNGSAMDSFGVKYALLGDTGTKGHTQDYKKFIPGRGALGSIAAVTGGTKVRDACNKILSPEAAVASAALTGALAVSVVGSPLAVAKGALQEVGKLAIVVGGVEAVILILEKAHVFDAIGSLLSPLIEKGADALVKDWTKDIQGEDVGNALTAGTGAYYGQVASAGGNMPLTQDQAVAYRTETEKVLALEAEVDRATLSPLDASNPNTFLGSIVTRLLPYQSNFSTISGSLAMFGNIIPLTASSIMPVSRAADASKEYSLCEDSNVKNSDVAADPFCNIEYGIPSQYLDKDPGDVLTSVSSDIDPDTGVPKDGSDLKDWVDQCTNGELYQSASCIINDQKTANYALYLTDSRIIESMDNEPPKPGGSGDIGINIGTYNVRSSNQTGDVDARSQYAAQNIQEKSMDVVGLQEAEDDQVKKIQTQLSDYDHKSASTRTIFWNKNKFSLVKSDEFTVPKESVGQNRMLWVKLKATNGGEFYVINIHPDVDSEANRKTTAEKVLSVMKDNMSDGLPVVIVGDMNSGDQYATNSGGRATGRDVNKVFMDSGLLTYSYQAAATKTNADYKSFNGFGKLSKEGGDAVHLDQIYITSASNPTVNSWENVINDNTSKASDHNPVFVNISIPGVTPAISSGGGTIVSGDAAWPLGKDNYDKHKSSFLGAHYTGGGFLGDGSHSNDITWGGISGSRVYAIFGGTVSKQPIGRSSYQCSGTPNISNNGGLQITSKVSGGTLVTVYAHGNAVQFKNGDTMKTGDYIMNIGNVGNSCGAHIHMDMAFNGQNVCTQDLFRAMESGGQVDFSNLVQKAKGRPKCG